MVSPYLGRTYSVNGGNAMSVAYNPASRFEIKTWDTEFRRIPMRTMMARVYQPQGGGPFPVLLDLHGGAWNNQDRTANAMMDEALAKSGILVDRKSTRLNSSHRTSS